MRIECGNGDEGFSRAELTFHGGTAADKVGIHPFFGDHVAGTAQRHMAGKKKDPEGQSFKHGEGVRRSGESCENFGVTDIRDARSVEAFLVDGRGGYGIYGAAFRRADRFFNRLECEFSSPCADLADRYSKTVDFIRIGGAEHHGFTTIQNVRICYGCPDYFGPDSRGISRGNAYSGFFTAHVL